MKTEEKNQIAENCYFGRFLKFYRADFLALQPLNVVEHFKVKPFGKLVIQKFKKILV